MTIIAQFFRHLRMAKEVADLIGRTLDRMGEDPRQFGNDLNRDSSHRTPNHRLLLP